MALKIQHGEYVMIGNDHLAMRGSYDGQWHLARMYPEGLDIRLVTVPGDSSGLFTHLGDAIEHVERVIDRELTERMRHAADERDRAVRRMDPHDRDAREVYGD